VWLLALDLSAVALLGWSLGGEVAQLLALRQPQRIVKLLLMATTPRFAAAVDWEHGLPETQLKAMARDLKRNYLATMEGFFNLQFAAAEIDRERHRQIVAFAVRAGRLPSPEVALAALETLRCEDLRPQLAQIKQPTLVLHGAGDRIIPVGAGRYLGTGLPAAHYVEWAGIGHAPFLTRPQQTLQLWREFLA
jgi:pimeloyl-[acyl-carrier protein] methyl ester esterase